MTLNKRIGTLLREARESRKLSIQETAREINMIPKFIEALEREDYSLFPSETYTLGFLRTYSEFLGLDTDEVLSLYRGVQIDQAETPIKELTKPISPADFLSGFSAGMNVSDLRKYVLYGGGILLAGLLVYGLFTAFSGFHFGGSAANDPCADRNSESVRISENEPVNFSMNTENSLSFVTEGNVVSFCATGFQSGAVIVAITVNNELYPDVRIRENENYILNTNLEGLAGLESRLILTPSVIAGESAGVTIRTEPKPAEPEQQVTGDATVPDPAPKTAPSDMPIQVSLQFTEDSYLEWNDDGNSRSGIMMQRGEIRTFEAKTRLDIKIGNGAGVRILREGQNPKIAGPRGNIVKISYRLIPSPLDPAKSEVQETIEVVR